MIRYVRIRKFERGLLFREGAIERVLGPGVHLIWDPRWKARVDRVSIREPWLRHDELRAIVRSGVLGNEAVVVELGDHQRAFVWVDGHLEAMLGPGLHALWQELHRVQVEVVSVREARLVHREVEVIARSGVLGDEARVLELGDHQRALVRVDGRITEVIGPGAHVLWNVFHRVEAEVVETRGVRFEHPELPVILAAKGASQHLNSSQVDAGTAGVVYHQGRHLATVGAGLVASWKGEGQVQVFHVDLREQATDVSGQEIMTSDKVTLRLNAVVTYRVTDVLQAINEVEDYRQALYREAQLALRAVVGSRELSVLLDDKEAVARELHERVAASTDGLGVEVTGLGIRDVILPGDMRELLNRVTEARTAAEASLVTRREETAAMRSQANTARIMESNPTLMRLRELEVLEKVAATSNLTVMLGEGGLADRVVKLL